MEPEAIMICIDNSVSVPKDGFVYKAQLEAIRFYIRAKLNSNPKTRMGMAPLGCGASAARWPHLPDSDVEQFLTCKLERIVWGGPFALISGLGSAMFGFMDVPIDMNRRLLVFVSGPGYLMDVLLGIGQRLKKRNIALDIVCFEDEDQEFDLHKTKCLRSFVASANRGNNSHFARVPRHSSSSVRDILVRSKILSRLEAEAVPLVEEVIEKTKKKRKLTRNRKKKNHLSQQHPEEEQPLVSSSSSSPPVILPAHIQVPQKSKNENQLVFGCWQMHQLVEVLSLSS